MNPGRATSTSAIGSVRMMRCAIADATVHGRHAHSAGQPQGDVTGIVAVLAFLGAFDSQLDWWNWRQGPVGLRQFQGIADQFADQIPRRARHVEFTLSFARLTL